MMKKALLLLCATVCVSALTEEEYLKNFKAWAKARGVKFIPAAKIAEPLTKVGITMIPTDESLEMLRANMLDIMRDINAKVVDAAKPTASQYEDWVRTKPAGFKEWLNTARTGEQLAAAAHNLKAEFLEFMTGVQAKIGANAIFTSGSGGKYASKTHSSVTSKAKRIQMEHEKKFGFQLAAWDPLKGMDKSAEARKARAKIRKAIEEDILRVNDALRGTLVVKNVDALKASVLAFKNGVNGQFGDEGADVTDPIKNHVMFDNKMDRPSLKKNGYFAIHSVFVLKGTKGAGQGKQLLCEMQFHPISVNDLSDGCPKEQAHRSYNVVRDLDCDKAENKGTCDQANAWSTMHFAYGYEHIEGVDPRFQPLLADATARAKHEARMAAAKTSKVPKFF